MGAGLRAASPNPGLVLDEPTVQQLQLPWSYPHVDMNTCLWSEPLPPSVLAEALKEGCVHRSVILCGASREREQGFGAAAFCHPAITAFISCVPIRRSALATSIGPGCLLVFKHCSRQGPLC